VTGRESSSREWNSAAYHCLSDPQVSWGKRVLSRLSLRGDELVLDGGCGTGRLTRDLLDALPRGCVVGVDLSQNMLKSAREYLAPLFGSRIHLLACDLLDLPFRCVFDVVVSTAAFHWMARSPMWRRAEPRPPSRACQWADGDSEIRPIFRRFP